MPNVFGIDLGTTNSCVAYIDNFGRAAVQRNANGDTFTPSVVYYGENNRIVVGRVAKNQRIRFPERTVSSVKRKMDTSEMIELADRKVAPAAVSAAILKALVDDANASLDPTQRTRDVVITCPAYFSQVAKQNTVEAAKLAGLNLLRLLAEPTAAAISYAQSVNFSTPSKFMVFDLGGGTLDMTILEVNQRTYTNVVQNGDAHLGGDDWDRCLAGLILAKFNASHNDHLTLDKIEKNDRKTYYTLLTKAEELKRNLSALTGDNVDIGLNGKMEQIAVTRKEFETAASGLMGRVIEALNRLLDMANRKGFQFSSDCRIVLVGGSSRMPMIKTGLQRAFSKRGLDFPDASFVCYEPDLSIAMGAAYVADAVKKGAEINEQNEPSGHDGCRVGKHLFEDVTPMSYGTICCINNNEHDEAVRNIIIANDALPVTETAIFTTIHYDQRATPIDVWESDSMNDFEKLENAKRIDAGQDLLIPAGFPAGTSIKVEFSLNQEGLLSVKAMLRDYPLVNVSFEIKLRGVLNEEQRAGAARELERSKIGKSLE